MGDWREVFERRRRRRRNLLLLTILIAAGGYWAYATARQAARVRTRDTLQLNQLKVNWGEFRGHGEKQGDTVVVTLWFEVVLINGPEVEAHLSQPNSMGKYATLFRNGSVRALTRAELDAALVGHTVDRVLRPRE